MLQHCTYCTVLYTALHCTALHNVRQLRCPLQLDELRSCRHHQAMLQGPAAPHCYRLQHLLHCYPVLCGCSVCRCCQPAPLVLPARLASSSAADLLHSAPGKRTQLSYATLHLQLAGHKRSSEEQLNILECTASTHTPSTESQYSVGSTSYSQHSMHFDIGRFSRQSKATYYVQALLRGTWSAGHPQPPLLPVRHVAAAWPAVWLLQHPPPAMPQSPTPISSCRQPPSSAVSNAQCYSPCALLQPRT